MGYCYNKNLSVHVPVNWRTLLHIFVLEYSYEYWFRKANYFLVSKLQYIILFLITLLDLLCHSSLLFVSYVWLCGIAGCSGD